MEEMKNLPEEMQLTEYDEGTDINKKLIINMRELNHIMRFLYEGKASQQRILIILDEVKTITQRDLTARLKIQPGSASEILAKLENAGLILRTMSETDKRTANISLTEEGRQMALDAAKRRWERHKEMFSCLAENEKEELLSLLEKLNADWTGRYGRTMEERKKHHMHKYEEEGRHGHRHGHEEERRDGHEGGHDHEKGHRYDHEGEYGHAHDDEGAPRHEHDHGRGHGHGHGHGKHDLEMEEISDVEIR